MDDLGPYHVTGTVLSTRDITNYIDALHDKMLKDPMAPRIQLPQKLKSWFFPFFFFLRFYVFIWENQREHSRGKGQREKQTSWEPDAGLDPRTLGSWTEPEADT